MQVAIDARYLSEPFGSMTVYCSQLLRALVELGLGSRPAALVPRDLHESAMGLRDELGDQVQWLVPRKDAYGRGDLKGELRWVHIQVPELLATRLPGADVLITVYHHPPFRLSGVHRVAVLHDLCALGEGFPKHKKAFWRHYLRLRAAAHLSDTIWPISEATRSAMSRRFPASRARLGPVVYNGVNRQPSCSAKIDEILTRYNLPRLEYVVAFSTNQKRKNFAATLEALTILKARGSPIRLVGISPARERHQVEEWCAAEGHPDAVILSGIPDETLDALYAGALGLSWPSTCEGFGYPVVEAMVQGCPPLVWAAGPGAELVGHAFDPMASVSPLSIADRLEALQSLAEDDRWALAERLRDRAADFSLDSYRQQIGDALKRAQPGHAG